MSSGDGDHKRECSSFASHFCGISHDNVGIGQKKNRPEMVMRILSCTAVDTNEAKGLAIRFFHLLSSCPSSSHSPPPAPCHRPPARQRWLLPSPPPHRLSPLRLGFRYTRSPPSFISWLATSSICAALPFFFFFQASLPPF